VAYVSLCFSIFHTIAYNTSKCVIAVWKLVTMQYCRAAVWHLTITEIVRI
jgi:hypothetical protein